MPTERLVDIEVVGLREFLAQLRKAPERTDLEIRKRFRVIANRVRDLQRTAAEGAHPKGGAAGTASRGSRGGRVQHWRDLVNSIRSGTQSDSPYVAIGSDRVPWALGFEFGSLQYRQFPPWRGNGRDAGHFFWPTLRDETARIVDEMGEAVDAALSEAYPE